MSFALNYGKKYQNGSVHSFVGGVPVLPSDFDWPVCSLCSQSLCFYIQIAFPNNVGNGWNDFTLAVFSCISCARRGHFIPEMLKGVLPGIDIPAGFLDSYQKNFAFRIYPTADGALVDGYMPVIAFREIVFKPGEKMGSFGKLGGDPIWMLDDESPGSYSGNIAMQFLMQIKKSAKFVLLEDAPRQQELNIFGELEDSTNDYASLFLGNQIYLFGTSEGTKLIYALTQTQRFGSA